MAIKEKTIMTDEVRGIVAVMEDEKIYPEIVRIDYDPMDKGLPIPLEIPNACANTSRRSRWRYIREKNCSDNFDSTKACLRICFIVPDTRIQRSVFGVLS